MTVKKKLTPKQEMFCREYLVDLNGAQAAIRAGYSASAAKEIAAENLTKPNVQEYIEELKEKRQESVEINAEWVLKQAIKVHEMTIAANDHTNALKSLDLIGKHINIKAFDKNESHHHTGEFKLDVVFVTKESNKDDSDIDNTYSR